MSESSEDLARAVEQLEAASSSPVAERIAPLEAVCEQLESALRGAEG